LRFFDAIIGRVLHRANRQVLNFPETGDPPPLPPPDADRRYLLYLHIPYCQVLCPFCSFHRVRFKRPSAEPYFDSLRREIRFVSSAGYVFDELYVGGGTPTVMPDELSTTLDLIHELHPLRSISIETNPDDLEKDSVQRLREAGVNRLSVGVQSFDDDLLREMQRFENYGSGDAIIRRLKSESGTFDTLNIDMIFNFPHQTENSLRRDLEILVNEIGADQVSWYPLMAAASTQRSMLQSMGRIDFSRERRFYEIIVEQMSAAGYARNSAWCFSRKPGMFDEYIVNHDEYIGLGSGAFSYLQGNLYASTFSINHYGQLVTAGKTGMVSRRVMSERDQMRYYLLMRLFAGSLDKDAAEERFGGHFARMLWPELTALTIIHAIRNRGRTVTLTENGYYLWVMMMREFFSGVGDLRDQMRHHISAEHVSRIAQLSD